MEATFDILPGLIKYSSVAISIKGRSRAFRIESFASNFTHYTIFGSK